MSIAATPVATPAAGTYSSAQSVVLTSATPGASIYYTVDGTEPNAGTAPASPLDLAFSVVANADYAKPQPTTLIDGVEQCASDSGQFTRLTEGTLGSISFASNTLTITHTAEQNDLVRRNTTDLTMPQVFVSVDINVRAGASTGYDNSGVGLIYDARNFIFASVDRKNSIARIQVKVGGSNTFVGSITQSFPTTFKLGLSLVGNSACLWLDTGDGWVYVTGYNVQSYRDFQTIGNLAGWQPGFTLASGSSSIWSFSNLTWGRYGSVGMRDQMIVTDKHANAVVVLNTVTFTATCPDPRGVCYVGVFELNLTTFQITQRAAILISRSGRIHLDLAMHVMVDSGVYRVLVSTWGNGFGGQLYTLYGTYVNNILAGSTVLAGMVRLNLPQATGSLPGDYDAMLAFDSRSNKWSIAYVVTKDTTFAGSPFYLCVAQSSNLVTWSLLGSDVGHLGYEGARIFNIGGMFWYAVGGPAGAGNSSRVFDATMAYVGTLNAEFTGGSSTQPHPSVFTDGTSYFMLTFDATKHGADFTWGKPVVYKAAPPTPNGIAYSVPIQITSTKTVRAVATAFDYANSAMLTAAYLINLPVTFQILAPCTLQMLCDSKVANSSSGRRRTVSRDSSFVFSATLNLPSECEQFESTAYNNFPVIGDCEIRQLDLVKYTFRDTEKTSSVKCMIVPGLMNKRTGDFRISCEPNISVDEAMLVATGSSSLEVLSSSRALSLKCVWTVSFLAATQFIEWLRGSVNRIFTTSVAGMKGVACQIGDSVSLEIGSTDVKISADLAIVNTKQFPLNVTASRVGNVVTVNTGTVYIGTLVNRLGEIVEVVTTLSNILTFTTYPENCYLLIRDAHSVRGAVVPDNNVTEWLEL